VPLPSDFQNIAKRERPRKPRKCEPESKVKDDIKKAFEEEAPRMWWYMPVQGPEGEHGIPDFIGCCPVKITQDMVGQEFPLFLSVEAKAEDGKVSPVQKICIGNIRDAKGIAWIVRGVQGARDLRDKLRALLHATR
jgi:hypothetical protein